MQWKTITTRVDIDTGEVLYLKDLNNYVLINKEKKTDYDNRTINQTKTYKRVYTNGLFG